MSVINAVPLLAAAGGDYQISRSVRLRNSVSAYLNRTPASASNRQTYTYSGWVKRGLLTTRITLMSGYTGTTNGTLRTHIIILDDATLQVNSDQMQTATDFNVVTTQVFRDPSAWYHVVVAVDTTQATSTNRVKVYINGVQVTSFSSATYPSLNYQGGINFTNNQFIGRYFDSTGGSFYGDGYLTEINFIDGQALTPSSFGQNDPVTGVWQPKKYLGTYGTNGFYLNFSDNSAATAAAIGKDYSGNGNNWTPNNISVTAGSTYDSMLDVPTPYADGGNGRGNYCVMNPLNGVGASFANANLQVTHSAATSGSLASFELPTTGKWYWESTITQLGSSSGIGILRYADLYLLGSGAGYGQTGGSYTYREDGTKRNNASGSVYGASYTTNDVIGIAYDADNNTLTFYKNGTTQGTAWSSLTDKPYTPVFGASVGTANIQSVNFGQRPFTYTPPTGFKALNTQNLPDSTIKAGNKYFDVKLRTGTGSSSTITGIGFQPDLVWVKQRSGAAQNHFLMDSARGKSGSNYYRLQTDTTAADDASVDHMTAITSDGYTVGASAGTNANTQTYADWLWKKGATPGFDIVTYTGTGVARTVAHSLGVAPKMMIVKTRSAVSAWLVYHASLGTGKVMVLNGTNAVQTLANYWDTAPDASNILLGNSSDVNASGSTFVAYLFSEVAGFSKFGSYTGSNTSDGPFVYCGFRPRWIMVKAVTTQFATTDWSIIDTARESYNINRSLLRANTSAVEDTSNVADVDILSNGFKLRYSPNETNGPNTYIFAAFAENPFKNSLAR